MFPCMKTLLFPDPKPQTPHLTRLLTSSPYRAGILLGILLLLLLLLHRRYHVLKAPLPERQRLPNTPIRTDPSFGCYLPY
jgi:hypothetical protein